MNPGNRRRSLLICALLCVVTLAAFWPVRNNDFISLDDHVYIIDNPHVCGGLTWENFKWSFQAGYAGYWHPVTWFSHMLDVQLFGLNPRWHHLVNLLFHLVNTLLLFLLFESMTGRLWRCAMVAALFAVHPLHVESVAWAAERKDMLSTLFLLLTLWAYSRYALGSAITVREPVIETNKIIPATGWSRVTPHVSCFTCHASRFYWLSLVFFALGLMSKPMLVTVPAVLLLLDVWPLGRVPRLRLSQNFRRGEFPESLINKNNKEMEARGTRPSDNDALGRRRINHLLLEKLPFLVLSLAVSWITFVAQGMAHAVSAISTLPLSDRLANAVVSCWKYLGKMFWPANLAVYYPYPKEFSLLNNGQSTLAVLALIAVSLFALYRIRRFPWLAAGWFWFLITLLPVIGIVQVGGQAMADRFTYIPLIGIFICLVWAGAELFDAWGLSKIISAATSVVVVVVCAVMTHRQLGYWRNTVTLANHALVVTGVNPVAEDMLGQMLWKEGQYDLAMVRFQTAFEAAPDFTVARSDLANALNWSGRTLAAQGRLEDAVTQFQDAARLYPDNPDANLELGVALVASGRTNEATQWLSAALRLEPDLIEKNVRDSLIFEQNGQWDAALRCLTIATWLQPGDTTNHENLGLFCLHHSRLDEAVAQFEEAIRLRPDAAAHGHLGLALALQAKDAAAIAHYETAMRMKPDSPEVLNDFAWLLATTLDARLRDGPRATTLAEQACRLTDFKQPALLGTLAAAYAEAGRFADAEKTAEKAVALATAENNPDLAIRNRELLELYRAGKTAASSHSSPAQ